MSLNSLRNFSSSSASGSTLSQNPGMINPYASTAHRARIRPTRPTLDRKVENADDIARQCISALRLDPGFGSRVLQNHFDAVFKAQEEDNRRKKDFRQRMAASSEDIDPLAHAEAERINKAMEDFIANDPFSEAHLEAVSSPLSIHDAYNHHHTYSMNRGNLIKEKKVVQTTFSNAAAMFLEGLSPPASATSTVSNSSVPSTVTSMAPKPSPPASFHSASDEYDFTAQDFRESEEEMERVLALYMQTYERAQERAKEQIEAKKLNETSNSVGTRAQPFANTSNPSYPEPSSDFQESFGMTGFSPTTTMKKTPKSGTSFSDVSVPMGSQEKSLANDLTTRPRALSESLFDFHRDDTDEYTQSRLFSKSQASTVMSPLNTPTTSSIFSTDMSVGRSNGESWADTILRLTKPITPSDILLLDDDIAFASIPFERQMYLSGKKLAVETWNGFLSVFRLGFLMLRGGIFDPSWDEATKKLGQAIYWLRFAPSTLPLLIGSTALTYFSKPLHLGTLVDVVLVPDY